MPAKLGVGTEPSPTAAEVGADVPGAEEVALASFAEAAARRAWSLALCAETASQAPIAMTNGMRKPAKTANTLQPIPLPVSVWPTGYVLMMPPRFAVFTITVGRGETTRIRIFHDSARGKFAPG